MTEESRKGGENPVVDEPRHRAFATQRHAIKEKDRMIEELQAKLDEKEDAGDPGTAAIRRQMRSMQGQIDNLLMSDIDNDQLEIVMANNPWIESIPNKVDRIQAAKKIIAVDQQAETNAGDPPNAGRSKSEAANRAHLTGGGPSAAGPSSRSDEEAEEAKFEKAMTEAKTQDDRDKIAFKWAKDHGEDPI